MADSTRRTIFSGVNTSGLGTDTSQEFNESVRRDGLVAALIITGLAGTSPSITGFIDHSPDGVNWVALLTFVAQTAVGANVQTLAAGTSYFSRLRARVVRGGTAVTDLDYEVAIQ